MALNWNIIQPSKPEKKWILLQQGAGLPSSESAELDLHCSNSSKYRYNSNLKHIRFYWSYIYSYNIDVIFPFYPNAIYSPNSVIK